MAYPTDGLVVWEVNDTVNANDGNGGAYYADGTAGAVDKSQGAAIVRNDLVIAATTTQVTLAGTPFTSSDVNNIINITGGAGFTTGRRRIVSVAAGVATLSSSAGIAGSTGGEMCLGGPMRTPGMCAAAMTAIGGTFNTVWITGSHTINSDTANIANGRPVFTNGTVIRGYHAVRGDDVLSATMLPLIDRTINSSLNSIEAGSATSAIVSNVRFTATGSGRVGVGSCGIVSRCWFSASEINASACRFQNSVLLIGFGLYNDSTTIFNNCYANCSFNVNANGTWIDSLLVFLGSFSFADNNNQLTMSGCSIVGPGTLISGNGRAISLDRCVLYSTNSVATVTGEAIHPTKIRLTDCAYNVTPTNSANNNGTLYAGDPFRNRAGGDFRLTDALYGALAATTNLPGLSATTFPRTIGAVPATAAGGGGMPMIGSRIGKAA